jgi:D-serine dehydratase
MNKSDNIYNVLNKLFNKCENKKEIIETCLITISFMKKQFGKKFDENIEEMLIQTMKTMYDFGLNNKGNNNE